MEGVFSGRGCIHLSRISTVERLVWPAVIVTPDEPIETALLL